MTQFIDTTESALTSSGLHGTSFLNESKRSHILPSKLASKNEQ